MHVENIIGEEEIYARLGIPLNDNTRKQFTLFLKAMRIFVDREEVHHSLWAEFDEGDAAHHMRSKLMRIQHALSFIDLPDNPDRIYNVMDDALDLMNYTAFLMRHLLGWKPDQSGEAA
jgi:DNA-binding SARP family transcriptional activator